MAETNNRGALWKNKVNYQGKFIINGTEYNVKLWKLENGRGVLVFTGDGPLQAEQILLFPQEDGPSVLSGIVGTKDNRQGYVNVFANNNTEGNDKSPQLKLTYKSVGVAKQNDTVVNNDF
jgi:hypothetical protein